MCAGIERHIIIYMRYEYIKIYTQVFGLSHNLKLKWREVHFQDWSAKKINNLTVLTHHALKFIYLFICFLGLYLQHMGVP